jgi:hypothetical protein
MASALKGATLEVGEGAWVFHADAFDRQTKDGAGASQHALRRSGLLPETHFTHLEFCE